MAARRQSKYEEIASDLRTRIQSGEYPVDAQLPTKHELMKRWNVALNTVDSAIRELVAAGLVETQHGRGMFVRKAEPEPEGLSEQVAALQREVAELREQAGAIPGLAAKVGRIEANLMALYQQVGRQYPRGKRERKAAGDGRR